MLEVALRKVVNVGVHGWDLDGSADDRPPDGGVDFGCGSGGTGGEVISHFWSSTVKTETTEKERDNKEREREVAYGSRSESEEAECRVWGIYRPGIFVCERLHHNCLVATMGIMNSSTRFSLHLDSTLHSHLIYLHLLNALLLLCSNCWTKR